MCGPKTKGSVINLNAPVIQSQCFCISLGTQEDIIAVSCVGLPATQPGRAGNKEKHRERMEKSV